MLIRENPPIKFSLSGQEQIIKPNGELWNAPLPVTRKKNAQIKSGKGNSFSITYGDYFEAARTFIEKNYHTVLLKALSCSEQDMRLEHVSEIQVILEKHGQFYHPAKIVVVADDSSFFFVLNVAISQTSIDCAGNEYLTLQKLHAEIPNRFIPLVYGHGKIISKRSDLPIGMFLAQWFEGFHEFHISKDPADGRNKIIVWDHTNGNHFISKECAAEIYRQAAMIMTFFYNIYTFEQIFPWHHAAGDFVVKIKDNKPEVKLITARQYAPLYEADTSDEESDLIYEGLLIFILILSIRMRLDRLDGTGDVVWADNEAVEGTIKGFMDGIHMKGESNMIPCDINNKLINYLLSHSEDQLLELSNIVVNSFNQSAPDILVVNKNLSRHSSELYQAIRKLEI